MSRLIWSYSLGSSLTSGILKHSIFYFDFFINCISHFSSTVSHKQASCKSIVSSFISMHYFCQETCFRKAPITTAADDKFYNIFPKFRKKGMIFHENRLPTDDSHEISCLFCHFFEKAAKLEIVVCCKL